MIVMRQYFCRYIEYNFQMKLNSNYLHWFNCTLPQK